MFRAVTGRSAGGRSHKGVVKVVHGRFLKLAVPLAVGAVIVSACSSSKSPSSTTSSSSGATSISCQTPAAAGAARTLTVQPAAYRSLPRQSKPTYTIAYQGPLSGGNAQLGLYMDNAVKLAIDAANAGVTFGALPFTLKFTEADDMGLGSGGPSAATKLINNSNVVAVVGPAFSSPVRTSEPLFAAAHMASVSPSATAADLTQHGWSNFFRVIATDDIQAAADALYSCKVLKTTNAYVVNDASAYASPLAASFARDLRADGIKVETTTAPGSTQCSAGTGSSTQYPAVASLVKSSGANLVYYAGYYCDLALFVKALRAGGYNGQIMSDDGSENVKLIQEAGQANAQGILTSCACLTTFTSAAGRQFAAGFERIAHFAPGTYSAESFDATDAIISVMKSLGTHVTRAGIVAGLKTIDYPGLSKTVKFTSTGDIAGTAVYMYKVQGAGLTTLGLVSSLAGS
jgi:branched-chain amino acid transport system substrate-binding protein